LDSLTSWSDGAPLPEGPPSSSVRIGLLPHHLRGSFLYFTRLLPACPPKAFSHVVISALICLILSPTRAGISRSRLGQKRED
jgi:hypothetical protein